MKEDKRFKQFKNLAKASLNPKVHRVLNNADAFNIPQDVVIRTAFEQSRLHPEKSLVQCFVDGWEAVVEEHGSLFDNTDLDDWTVVRKP